MGLVRLDSYYAWRFSRIVNLDNYDIMPTIIKNGIQYNVSPNAIGASELTITTPEVEVAGKAPTFDSRQSSFNRNELINSKPFLSVLYF